MQSMNDMSQIAWSRISIASGSADNIPQALQGLISPDEKVRNRSYWQLDNRVVLQSDLFEAAYFIIPFLIQFLDDKVVHGRDRIYDLLYEIAHGSAPVSVRCRTSAGDEVSLKEACDREVRIGLPVFRRDAADVDAGVSAKAKQLLELLVGHEPANGNGKASGTPPGSAIGREI